MQSRERALPLDFSGVQCFPFVLIASVCAPLTSNLLPAQVHLLPESLFPSQSLWDQLQAAVSTEDRSQGACPRHSSWEQGSLPDSLTARPPLLGLPGLATVLSELRGTSKGQPLMPCLWVVFSRGLGLQPPPLGLSAPQVWSVYSPSSFCYLSAWGSVLLSQCSSLLCLLPPPSLPQVPCVPPPVHSSLSAQSFPGFLFRAIPCFAEAGARPHQPWPA